MESFCRPAFRRRGEGAVCSCHYPALHRPLSHCLPVSMSPCLNVSLSHGLIVPPPPPSAQNEWPMEHPEATETPRRAPRRALPFLGLRAARCRFPRRAARCREPTLFRSPPLPPEERGRVRQNVPEADSAAPSERRTENRIAFSEQISLQPPSSLPSLPHSPFSGSRPTQASGWGFPLSVATGRKPSRLGLCGHTLLLVFPVGLFLSRQKSPHSRAGEQISFRLHRRA